MTKYFSIFKVQQGIIRYIISYQIQYKTNDLLTILKAGAILLVAEQMCGIHFDKREKGTYINNFKKMDKAGNVEYAEKTKRK